MEATANDLRSRTKDLLDTVINGEEVIITYHGRPCAKLVPYQEAKGKSSGGELFRIWRQNPAGSGMVVSMSEG